jgi:hypothetical protein
MRKGLGLIAVVALCAAALMVGAGSASAAGKGPGIICITELPGCGSATFCDNGVTVTPDNWESWFWLYLSSFNPESGVTVGACPPTAPEPQGPDRYIYCAAAGNTDANGNPLGLGQTLNLEFGQPATDKHYAGATLGFWVKDVGLTCQLTPAQAALAAASTTKVNHTGAANTQEGAQVYTFVG